MVFCNGVGVITPFGAGQEVFLDSLRADETGIRISYNEDRDYSQMTASFHQSSLLHLTDYHKDLGISRFALCRSALLEAMEQAGYPGGFSSTQRVGIFVGAGFYPCDRSLDTLSRYVLSPEVGKDNFQVNPSESLARNFGLVNWLEKPMLDLWLKDRIYSKPSYLLHYLRQLTKGTGEAQLVNNLCVSSMQALDQACKALELHECDIAVVGGVEELSPVSYYTFHRLGAYSQAEDPRLACLPFDTRRQGVVLGEGAGFLILSRSDRGSLARITARASTNNCLHLTDPGATGDGIYRAMQSCVQKSGSLPDFIVAHGTGTPLNDPSECHAILRLFGNSPLVQSIKSRFGHTLAAAGVLNVISAIVQANQQFLAHTFGLEYVDPGCQVRHIPKGGVQTKVRHGLCNTSGFGGFNSCVMLEFAN